MILFPPAKINLGLNVLFKREDGFHQIDTCMLPIPLVDVLELLPAASFSFQQTGLVIPGPIENNLCVKAYSILERNFSIPPVYIHLRKEIPMGAGLGGGSSDAAYVLKGLDNLFDLKIPIPQLEAFAAELGSDCPFFIKNEAQFAGGRGEVLTESNLCLKGYFIKVVNPGIHIGTKEAYSGISFQTEGLSVKETVESPIENWKNNLQNTFEINAFLNHPILAEIKAKLYTEGAIYAAMSGSGSTLFGIYKNEPSRSFIDSSGFLETIHKFKE